jgi:hypothetical protein
MSVSHSRVSKSEYALISFPYYPIRFIYLTYCVLYDVMKFREGQPVIH